MQNDFGQLKRIDLRDVWGHEARAFTPWLCDNIPRLGEALGMDLELKAREAGVGPFSLDILARDLSSASDVVIENQLTTTDHDHLGKLITYAAGFDAGSVVWLSAEIREEHRQALDWLNQKTDEETRFFGVVVEVLRIDDSRPAFHFKPVVFPNEWQKTQHRKASGGTSGRGEAYREFFQSLIDEMRTKYHFTKARKAGPNNYVNFSLGVTGVSYGASFASGGRIRAEVYLDPYELDRDKALFDALMLQKADIEHEFGSPLVWERLDDRRASRIAIYDEGDIFDDEERLQRARDWFVHQLLTLGRVLGPRVTRTCESLRNELI